MEVCVIVDMLYSELWSFIFVHRTIAILWFCQPVMGEWEPFLKYRKLKLLPKKTKIIINEL